MTDLFTYDRGDHYPAAPGFKDRDTSRKAADSVSSRVETLRGLCLDRVRAAGAAGLTADEAAARVNETVLSIRPRFTELLALERIRDSGQRRRNESGRTAKVWVIA